MKTSLRIALRGLVKNKLFTAINLTGLSLGIICCLYLVLLVRNEIGYDQHHERSGDIYRLTTQLGDDHHFASSSPPIIFTALEEIPEIEQATRVIRPPGVDQDQFIIEDRSFFIEGGLIVDSTFFDIFSYDFLTGDSDLALDRPNTIVLTEELSNKLFGSIEVVGNTIEVNNQGSNTIYEVTGVVTQKGKSHIQGTYFTSMYTPGIGQYVAENTNWAGNNFIYSYFRVKPETDATQLEEKFSQLLNLHGGKALAEQGMAKELKIQSVPDIHLQSELEHEISVNANMTFIYAMIALAIFIMLIACINFINQATAMASRRAGEVGVRKTLGASQSVLIRQFLLETSMTVALAILISLFAIEILMPYLNDLSGIDVMSDTSDWLIYVTGILVLGIITSLLAGAYPAFFLSAFSPARVMKDKGSSHSGSGILRKGLVVFQFMIAICLISGIIIIQAQLTYTRNQDLGFRSEATLVIPLRNQEVASSYSSLKQSITGLHQVRGVSSSSVIPGRQILHDFRIYSEGSDMDRSVVTSRYFVEENFINLLGLEVLQGRVFDDSASYDIVVNTTALKELNIPQEEAIGASVFTDWEGETTQFRVVGVVNDFHQLSFHEPIRPIIFQAADPSVRAYMIVSIRPESPEEAITEIEKIWESQVDNLPFEYEYVSEQFQRQYESDKRIAKIIGVFALIAVFISCLGLYGLSVFMAERRMKEISIRKVLGAHITGIYKLLAKDFVILVGIAFILSIPLAYYVMDEWLMNFSYRIQIRPSFFLIAGGIALVIALLTISYNTIRTAMTNPAKTLKNEQ
jgi:putative ABC transport system permease protein